MSKDCNDGVMVGRNSRSHPDLDVAGSGLAAQTSPITITTSARWPTPGSELRRRGRRRLVPALRIQSSASRRQPNPPRNSLGMAGIFRHSEHAPHLNSRRSWRLPFNTTQALRVRVRLALVGSVAATIWALLLQRPATSMYSAKGCTVLCQCRFDLRGVGRRNRESRRIASDILDRTADQDFMAEIISFRKRSWDFVNIILRLEPIGAIAARFWCSGARQSADILPRAKEPALPRFPKPTSPARLPRCARKPG